MDEWLMIVYEALLDNRMCQNTNDDHFIKKLSLYVRT